MNLFHRLREWMLGESSSWPRHDPTNPGIPEHEQDRRIYPVPDPPERIVGRELLDELDAEDRFNR